MLHFSLYPLHLLTLVTYNLSLWWVLGGFYRSVCRSPSSSFGDIYTAIWCIHFLSKLHYLPFSGQKWFPDSDFSPTGLVQCDRATGLGRGDTDSCPCTRAGEVRACWRGDTWSPVALLHQTRSVTGNQENKINRKKNKCLIQMKTPSNEIVEKTRIILFKNIKLIFWK